MWSLYEKGELVQLVDTDLGGNFDVDEASRYLKIGLFCTQDEPKKRPSMSTAVKMLVGERDLDEKQLSKPRLLSELMGIRSQKNVSSYTESATSGKQGDSLSTENTTMTYASMSFTSIYDRST